MRSCTGSERRTFIMLTGFPTSRALMRSGAGNRASCAIFTMNSRCAWDELWVLWKTIGNPASSNLEQICRNWTIHRLVKQRGKAGATSTVCAPKSTHEPEQQINWIALPPRSDRTRNSDSFFRIAHDPFRRRPQRCPSGAVHRYFSHEAAGVAARPDDRPREVARHRNYLGSPRAQRAASEVA